MNKVAAIFKAWHQIGLESIQAYQRYSYL